MLIRIKALDQTGRAFKSVTAGLAGVTKSIFSMQTALGVVAGATGFGYLVKQSFNATDQLAKTASKIGTTTDALTKLHHTANLSGVSTDTMNMALQRFVRRTAEASKGTGEAVGALRELGINASELQQLPLDERMAVLADRFGQVKGQSDKLRLAFKLFDSEGAGLINTLNAGSDGMREMYAEAEDLGLVLQQSSAQGVEKTNDELYKLFSLGKGLFTQFTASLAPAIEAIATHLRVMFVEASRAKGGFKAIGDYLATNFIDGLVTGLTGLQSFINEVIFGYDKLMAVKRKLTGEDDEQEDTNERLRDQILLLGKVKNEYAKFKEAGTDLGLADAFMEASKGALELGFNLKNMSQVDDFNNYLNEVINNLSDKIVEPAQSGTVSFDGLIDKLKELKATIGTGAIIPEVIPSTEIEKVNIFTQSLKDLQNTVPDLKTLFDGFVKGAMNTFTQGFTDAITGAKKFGDAIKDMAKSVVDSLIKMLVQYYITQPLFNALSGGFGGGSAPSGTAYTANSIVGVNANGGSVSANQPYKVGEHGQELFIPNTNGAIVSNRDLNSGGSGVVINQTINLSTGVAQTVKAEVMNMMPQIANQTKQAVLDSRQRGGSFSRGLVGA